MELVKEEIFINHNLLDLENITLTPVSMEKNNMLKLKFLKDVISEELHIIKFVTQCLNVICVLESDNAVGVNLSMLVYLIVLKLNALIHLFSIERNV
jgi:hypothetical protein